MSTSLEERLRNHFTGERFRPARGWEAKVLERAHSAGSPAPKVHRRLLVASVLAALALLVGFTVLPAAAGTDLPWWAAGLRSAVRIDSSAGGRSTSWGSTMEVVGAYLDDERTIVVLKGPAPGTAIPNADLVAAGRRYGMVSATSSDDGYYAVKFGPLLPAPASPAPATLRLADGLALPPHVWTLTFAIGPRPRGLDSLPPPGQAGSMAVTFTDVTVVPGALALRLTETGVTYDEILGAAETRTDPATHITTTMRGPIRARVQAFDHAGRPLRWLDTEIVPGPGGGAAFSEVLLRTGPGPYRIVVASPSGQTLERVVAS